MSEDNAWESPENPEPAEAVAANVIDAKASLKRTDGGKTGFIGDLETGAIGVTAKAPTRKKAPVKQSVKKNATVAIHSTRNVVWNKIGKVEKGYNIVTQDEADKWLTRDHVRLATPEEVAREYGK
jgi:hypothetical protein